MVVEASHHAPVLVSTQDNTKLSSLFSFLLLMDSEICAIFVYIKEWSTKHTVFFHWKFYLNAGENTMALELSILMQF